MKKVIKVLSLAFLIITFIVVVLLVFTRVQGKTPQIFGYQFLRISSSSMEPRLQVGDIILSKKIKDLNTLEIGDIITYKGTQGSYSGKLITHEVVAKPDLHTDGKYYLQTKGVANDFPDPEISELQVTGEMMCKLPVLSSLYRFFQTPWGLISILGILAILFINELMRLFSLIKSKNIVNDDT